MENVSNDLAILDEGRDDACELNTCCSGANARQA